MHGARRSANMKSLTPREIGLMSVVSPATRKAFAPAELVLRWAGVLEDPTLRNLPYRIELNKWGHIEMTPPASPRHMSIASSLVRLLEDRLAGKAFTECAIVTSGVCGSRMWCGVRRRSSLATFAYGRNGRLRSKQRLRSVSK